MTLRYLLDTNVCVRVLRDRPASERERFKPRREEFAPEHATEIRVDVERRGEMIGPHDVMIAGHAPSRGLIVITGNLKEFKRVSGLRCEDWLD